MICDLRLIEADVRRLLGLAPLPEPAVSGYPGYGGMPPYHDGLGQLVRGVAERAAADVILQAPHHALGPGRALPEADIWRGDGGQGRMLLPANFLRLGVFEMDDWARPVYEAITADDPAYSLQRSRWAGLRGTPQRPVCAVVQGTWGLQLEFYSSAPDAKIRQARYHARPAIDAAGCIEVPAALRRAVVEAIADSPEIRRITG